MTTQNCTNSSYSGACEQSHRYIWYWSFHNPHFIDNTSYCEYNSACCRSS